MPKKHGLRPHEQRAKEQAENAGAQSPERNRGEPPTPSQPPPAKRGAKRKGKH